MKKWKAKNPALFLLLACYAGGLLVFLAVQGWAFAQNRLAYRSGQLQTARLVLADFEFDAQELELQEDGTLLSVGGDPQLRLLDKERRVENVSLRCRWRLNPILVNAFWAAPQQAYSPRRMAYAIPTDGADFFLLPAAGVQGLRLDLGTAVGNTITVEEIVINQPRPLWAFLRPTAGQALLLALLPGGLACGLWLAPQLLPLKLAKKAGENHG